MGVIKLPEPLRYLLASQEFSRVFAFMGLTCIGHLPMNVIDIPRVYKMLNNMDEEGLTKITDLLGKVTVVN